MGGFLSKSLEWKDETHLLDSDRNETTLKTVLTSIERICIAHERESSTPFARDVSFPSKLTLETLTGGPHSDEFIESGMNSVQSKDKDSSQRALYSLSKITDSSSTAVVRTVAVLARHLGHCPGPREQVRELRALLEAHQNIVNVISGIDGDAGDLLVKGFRLMNTLEGRDAQEVSARMQLMIVVNQLDLELMAQSIDAARQGGAELTLEQVSKELAYLQQFSRDGVQSILASIKFNEEYLFASGPQVPPWREARGELAYIVAHPTDCDEIHITAARQGYFINEGYVPDGKGDRRLEFERKSEFAPSLVDTISRVSQRFSKHADAQLGQFLSKQQATGSVKGGSATARIGAGARPAGDDLYQGAISARRRGGAARTQRHERRAQTLAELGKREPSARWQAIEPVPDPDLSARMREAARRKADRGALAVTGGGASAAAGDGTGASSVGDRQFSAYATESEDSDSETCGDDDFADFSTQIPAQRDYALYERVLKLVQIMREATETVTVLCLVHLLDSQLESEPAQFAMVESGGLDVLINLLAVQLSRCQVGALKVLAVLTQSRRMQSVLEANSGIQPLCELLRTGSEEVQRLAADTLGNCCDQARPCRAIRNVGGIRSLVAILEHAAAYDKPSDAIRSAARALWRCARSRNNRRAMLAANVVPTLAAILIGGGAETPRRNGTRPSTAAGPSAGGLSAGVGPVERHTPLRLAVPASEEFLIPLFGIVQCCAQDADFRDQVRLAGIVPYVIAYLSSSNIALQTQCAAALFRCAEDVETQLMLPTVGLAALVSLLGTAETELLVAVSGAVWKTAQAIENVTALSALGAVPRLVALLTHLNEEVQVNAAGALLAAAQAKAVRGLILEAGGLPRLVAKLKETNDQLLINATGAIGACALEPECLAVILRDDVDGVKFLWSLLKKKTPAVVAAAAWAICPCLTSASAPGHLINEFVGGLELVVGLLKAFQEDSVRAAVCAVIAQIATNEDNLGVITDHGAVWMLANLTPTTSDHLRTNLADAIARCADYGMNREAFAQAGAIEPLVRYLDSTDEGVHRATARALHQLSFYADNCVTMHKAGAVRPLIQMVGSADLALAEAAAGTLGNMRALALANERAKTETAQA